MHTYIHTCIHAFILSFIHCICVHVSRHVSKYGLAWPGMAWHVRMYVCMHAWMFSSSRGPRVSVRSDHLVHAVISMLVLVNLPRQPA